MRGVYGVPEQWPHIRAIYQRAGFAHTGHTEIVYLARVEDLPAWPAVPVAGLSARRSVGMNGTRLSAVLGETVIGYIEVETFDEGERLSRRGGWADIGNLRVTEQYRRCGVASWLLGQALRRWPATAGSSGEPHTQACRITMVVNSSVAAARTARSARVFVRNVPGASRLV